MTNSVSLTDILQQLGADLEAARKRRRISTKDMAIKLKVSRPTLKKIERGDPRVALGSYASALEIFGMAGRLADLASARHDTEGLALETGRLPKRIMSRNAL